MELLSITQAAELLKCSRQYTWSLIKMGRLNATKIGNTYVVDKENVEQLINCRTQAAKTSGENE